MGQILVKYYEYINSIKGLEGKQELARITKVPSILAGSKPDSPEYVEAFKTAIKQITGKDAPKF